VTSQKSELNYMRKVHRSSRNFIISRKFKSLFLLLE